MRYTGSLRTVAFASALVALGASTADAQILRGIGRRAADAVERKTEQKINSEIDKAAERLVEQSFESMFGPEDTTGSKKSGSSAGSRLFAAFPSAPTEEQYKFDVVFHYDIETLRKGEDPERGAMQMHFNTAGKYAGTRFIAADKDKDDGEAFIIFDAKNESMVMLIDSEDGKMSMAYSWKDAKRYADTVAARSGTTETATATATASAEDAATLGTYSHIGSKTIAGFAAEGYRSETADARMDVWISRDASLTFERMMGASSSMKQLRGTMPTNYPAGMLLETTTLNKKSGDTGRMTVTKVDKNAGVTVDMKEYPRLGKAAK